MLPYRMTLPVVIVFLLFTTLFAQEAKVKKVPARPTSVASGHEMFISYCASCHGQDAKGDGPAAVVLKIRPTDLTALARRGNGKFPASHVSAVLSGKQDVVAHGSSDMPVWGPIFRTLSQGSEAQVHQRINNLTAYIGSLQAK